MAGMVEFPSNGNSANGYLAEPPSGNGPGLIVIQEWWGLNDQIKRTADRFAAEGFVALAPDLFHGEAATYEEPNEAGKLLMALDADRAAQDVAGAARWLKAHEATTGIKVGVVGFCMGGKLALLTGSVAPEEVGAIVDMYGIHPNIHPDYSKMKAAVLGLFAGDDGSIPPEARQALSDELSAAGVSHEFHTYPGVDHAFMNEDREGVHDEEASRDAWGRILAFFRSNL
jgi:carboxymethylenebutenolidase